MTSSAPTTETSPLLRPTYDSNDQPRDETNAVTTDTLSAREATDELAEARANIGWIFATLAIGVFLSTADLTIIVSSSSRMGSDLNALDQAPWIATAYFLTLTSFQPLYGKFSDILSRRACLLIAYTFFGLGTLCCGLAQTMHQLIAARAFAGLGGGGLVTVMSITLTDILPLRERGTWQGYMNVIFTAGASAGAPLGGLITQSIGWRWCFFIQAPLCFVGFVAVFVLLDLPIPGARKHDHWKVTLKRIDIAGSTLLILTVFALLLGLDRGTSSGWTMKACLIPLCLSVPLAAALLFVETKFAAEPLLPARLIFQRPFFSCYITNFLSFASSQAAIFNIAIYFQAVQGQSPGQAGILLLPSLLANTAGALFCGFYIRKIGKYYWLSVIAYNTFAIGMGVIIAASIIDSTLGLIIGQVVSMFSHGIVVSSTFISLMANSPSEDFAMVTATSLLFRTLGSTVGVSLTASVVNKTLQSTITSALGYGSETAEIINGVRQSLEYLCSLEPGLRQTVRHCYNLSMRAGFGFDTALAVMAAVGVWFIVEKPLSK